MIVRDQLAVCYFYIKKADIERETSTAATNKKKNKQASTKKAEKAAMDGIDDLDEIFDDGNDPFIAEDSPSESSQDSSGEYITEQAHHNDLNQHMSIMERSSKFLFLIYIELLRIIRALERPDSYKRRNKHDSDTDMRLDSRQLSSSQVSQ